ncbi:protein trunk [Episyrphus balteatus]|uniref:protein trunk n=1 Tax=Episyrphus balteatus TaxID=286459 RepID=UPI00248503AE|nr:protein trunk [Episyrphus balteatus]XP_055853825.1 protein trunk [Episyrphus balteatus]
MSIFVYICGLVLLCVTHCDVRNINCPDLPEKALRAILGTTYNSRYMRIELPAEDNTESGGSKRASGHDDQDFFQDGDEENLYAGIPAWEVDHIEIGKSRPKRHHQEAPKNNRNARQAFIDKMTKSSKQDVFQSRPWDCKAEVHWKDLGSEYFPRYIRTVQCKKKNCWYGHYTCKPRWFSIKVLRRSTGQCAKVNDRFRVVTMNVVTGDYAQQWEFEEKAVTFCCDCVMEY